MYSGVDRQFDVEAVQILMRSFPSSRVGKEGLTVSETRANGSNMTITIRPAYSDGQVLYGADRKLLMWLMRRALRSREADVSWETLLEYLGPSPTKSQKKALFLSGKRISATVASCSDENTFLSIILVRARTYSHEHLIGPRGEFSGEICFEFSAHFLELVVESQRQKLIGMNRSQSPQLLGTPHATVINHKLQRRALAIIE
jgi:hypothetical protein